MKLLLLVGLILIGKLASSQTCCLKLTLDVNQMPWIQCNLNGAAFVYFYSGLCTGQISANCKDFSPRQGDVWQYIVGYFDDPPVWTLMTDEGNGIYTKYIDINGYYGNPAYISTIEGISVPKPANETPKAIGIVFGNEDGSISGRDQTCNDIFIDGLDGPDLKAKESCGTGCNTPLEFFPLTVEWVDSVPSTPTGINDFNGLSFLRAFPNPFISNTKIRYALSNDISKINVTICNSLGKQIRTLFSGKQVSGNHELIWNGDDDLGEKLPGGLYYFTVSNQSSVITRKLIILN